MALTDLILNERQEDRSFVFGFAPDRHRFKQPGSVDHIRGRMTQLGLDGSLMGESWFDESDVAPALRRLVQNRRVVLPRRHTKLLDRFGETFGAVPMRHPENLTCSYALARYAVASEAADVLFL